MTPLLHRSTGSIVLVLLVLMMSCAKSGEQFAQQLTYDSPESAATALVAALEINDPVAIRQLFGTGMESLVSSGDAIADKIARQAFVTRFRSRHQWVAGGSDTLVLQVGDDAWPMPIPLVLLAGRWRFDGQAGEQELLSRRIGANELHTIDVMRGFVVAETDYAASAHDGEQPGRYAQKLRSEPGKHDGLYWQPLPGEPLSPAGPLLAAAESEGYPSSGDKLAPYHGYLFKLLIAQGTAADGGPRSYFENGKLIKGVALVAWPVTYGVSGVMTFMVNTDGVVWQQDLGSDTAQLAGSMDEFNPDTAWTPIAPEDDDSLQDETE